MEQNKEMSAQRSLQLISETFNNSRKEILRGSAKYFMLWGTLLTVVSLVIYLLWHLHCKTLPATPRRPGQRLAAVPRRTYNLIVDLIS